MIDFPDIKRTTFKVDIKSIFSNRKLKNAFIDPRGHIDEVHSDWHHIELALKIIERLDYNLQSDIDNAKLQLKKLRRTYRESTDEFDREWCKDRIASWLKTFKNSPRPHFMEDFKNINMNRGLDAGEYLIVHHGYIAISDYKVVYLHTTKDQLKMIHCYTDKDDPVEILHKISDEEVKMMEGQEKYIRQISNAIKEYEHCNCSSNAFHCPSGVPRIGFDSRRRIAEQRFREVKTERFLEDASKFGIQWPKYTTDRHGGVTIDIQSFVKPGYNLSDHGEFRI